MTPSKNKSGNRKGEGLAIPGANNPNADNGCPSAKGQQMSLHLLMLVRQGSISVIYYKDKCGRNDLPRYSFPSSSAIDSWFLGAVINVRSFDDFHLVERLLFPRLPGQAMRFRPLAWKHN